MLNLPVSHKNDVMVMSSVDLAELCIGKGKDDHSNFMKKAKLIIPSKRRTKILKF